MKKKNKNKTSEDLQKTLFREKLFFLKFENLNSLEIEYIMPTSLGIKKQKLETIESFNALDNRIYRIPKDIECKVLNFKEKFQNIFYKDNFIYFEVVKETELYNNEIICIVIEEYQNGTPSTAGCDAETQTEVSGG